MSNENHKTEFETQLGLVMNAAYGMARHLTQNADAAEDLLQDATLKAYNSFASFERGTNFKAWFFRILVNHFLNDRRRRNAHPEVELDEVTEAALHEASPESRNASGKNDPACLLLDRLDAEEIRLAFAALPADFRPVAVLYFFDEFSYEQIANLVACPVGTVRSRLHRSRKLLQQSLRQFAEEKGIVRETN